MAGVTIREYFKGRSKRARRALGIGGIITIAAVALFAMTRNLNSAYGYVAVAGGLFGMAVMLGALSYLDRTRCPTCHQRLGIQIANQYRVGHRIAFCPFCGVGFDQCEVRSV
jgi:hypothetical protein